MTHAPLTSADIETLPQRLPNWSRIAVDGVNRLERTFDVPDYPTAVSFTQLLGEMADAAGHHPTVLVQRAHVTVAWWTFSTKSLTQIDLVMAERTDRLFEAILAGEQHPAQASPADTGGRRNRPPSAMPDTPGTRSAPAAEEY